MAKFACLVFKAGGSPPAVVEAIRAIERKSFLKADSLHESMHVELQRRAHCVAFADTKRAGDDGRPSPSAIISTATPPRKSKKKAGGKKKGAAKPIIPSGEVCGYVYYARQSLMINIEKVCVAAAFRKQGVGRLMMEQLLDEFARGCSGAAVVKLHVDVKNEAAIALYKRTGFHTVGRRENYYAPGRHAFAMEVQVSELQEMGKKKETSAASAGSAASSSSSSCLAQAAAAAGVGNTRAGLGQPVQGAQGQQSSQPKAGDGEAAGTSAADDVAELTTAFGALAPAS